MHGKPESCKIMCNLGPNGATSARTGQTSTDHLLYLTQLRSVVAEDQVISAKFTSRPYTVAVDQDARRVVTRRRVLTGAGAAALVAASVAADATPGGDRTPDRSSGGHQDGIGTPPLPFLSIAGFDVETGNRRDLVQVLRRLTDAVAALTPDGPTRLTVTIGFGPALFADDRFGILDRRPAALVPLPSFRGEAIDPTQSDGDLCVQACATDPDAAHHAIRTIVNTVRPYARPRWRQIGFRSVDSADPRGLLGFRDGTANVSTSDSDAMSRHVWVDDGGSWMHGGTYLVLRRIRLLLDTWDRVDVAGQEAMVGRRQQGNERIDAPANAHVRLAEPMAGTERILRRSYTYDAGLDPNGLLDAGLIFICFQRDPGRQFVPIQRRLADGDALNAFSQHTTSAVFACPPAGTEGSWTGAGLFE